MGDSTTLLAGHYYPYPPGTVAKIESGSSFTYVPASDTRGNNRLNKLHVLVCNIAVRIERGALNPVVSTLSGYWPANTPFQFRPSALYPNISVTPLDGGSFGPGRLGAVFIIDRDPIGITPLKILLDPTNGSFTRSTNGYYFTSANTLAVQPPNTRCLENRGDLSTPLVLINQSCTNLLTQSYDVDTTWADVVGGGSGDYTNPVLAPDGNMAAGRITLPVANATKRGPTLATGAGTGRHTIQTFYKAASSGSVGFPARFAYGTGNGISATLTPSNDWSFKTASGVVGANTAAQFVGTVNTPNVGDPNYTQWDMFVWGMQLTATWHEMPYIQTTGSTATRGNDVLTLSNVEYDPEFLTAGGTFTFYPNYSNLEYPSFTNYHLLSVGSTANRLMFESNASTVYMKVIANNVVSLQTNPVTFSKFAPLSITFQPSQGKLTLGGFTSGSQTYTGSAWSWPNQTVRIGGLITSNFEANGRFSAIFNIT